MPDETHTDSLFRKRTVVPFLVGAVIVPLLAAVVVPIWSWVVKRTPTVEAVLLQPVPAPGDNGAWIQCLIISNTGGARATGIETKIWCPRSTDPIDFSIVSLVTEKDVLREDDFLRLSVPCIHAGGCVLVSWITSTNGQAPTDIEIAYGNQVVPSERIKYISPTPSKWSTPR